MMRRLLQRLWPVHLGNRMALASALLMTLAISVFTTYVAWKTIAQARDNIEHATRVVARDIAAYSAGHLLVNDLAELELSLKRTMHSSDLDQVTILRPDGTPVIDMQRTARGRVSAHFGGKRRIRIPADDPVTLYPNKGILEYWTPIHSDGLIGWVRSRARYVTLPAVTRDVLVTSTAVIVLSLLLGWLMFRRLLQKPVDLIEHATTFAERLPRAQGGQLRIDTRCVEFLRLGQALNQASDLLQRQRVDRDRARHLLAIIRDLESRFIGENDMQAFRDMLTGLLRIMRCRHGMLAELSHDVQGAPFLRILATFYHDRANDPYLDAHRNEVIEMRNLDNLVGQTVLSGRPVIANQAGKDPRATRNELPDGHPRFNRFLGLPLYNGERLIGMLGIGNRDQDFSDDDVAFLQPLASSCGLVLDAWHRNLLREQAEAALKRSETTMRLTLETIRDAIVTIDQDAYILDANPAAASMFGHHLAGKPLTRLLTNEAARRFRQWWQERADDAESRLHAELDALNADGQPFPVELDIEPMRTDEDLRFLCMMRDISERQRMDRIKDEFIATVTHELRTPLTSIRGSLGLIESGLCGQLDERGKELLQIAHSNIQRLMTLIDDILTLERLQAQPRATPRERIDMGKLVRNAIRDNRGYADQHQVEFVIERCVDGLFVDACPHNLFQVMANLLSNAAKFSPPGSRIPVSVNQTGQRVRVEICNPGPGIPPEIGKRIFDRFVQGDASDSRHYGGTGLGLSICRHIVEQHDGIIDYASTLERGTCFFFEIPLAGGASSASGEQPAG